MGRVIFRISKSTRAKTGILCFGRAISGVFPKRNPNKQVIKGCNLCTAVFWKARNTEAFHHNLTTRSVRTSQNFTFKWTFKLQCCTEYCLWLTPTWVFLIQLHPTWMDYRIKPEAQRFKPVLQVGTSWWQISGQRKLGVQFGFKFFAWWIFRSCCKLVLESNAFPGLNSNLWNYLL